jgi:hypothetical protein
MLVRRRRRRRSSPQCVLTEQYVQKIRKCSFVCFDSQNILSHTVTVTFANEEDHRMSYGLIENGHHRSEAVITVIYAYLETFAGVRLGDRMLKFHCSAIHFTVMIPATT